MNIERKTNLKINQPEKGAALVTVLMVSVLLGIACVAMLSAVGANSKNSTDVLSETKAYYSAESGLQSTINVLRGNTDTTPNNPNDDIDYTKASTLALSNYSGDPNTSSRLSAWITYNYPTTGTPDRVVIGEPANTYNPKLGAAYSIVVSDPDNSAASLTFNTSGIFLSGGTISGNGKTIYYPNNTAANRIEITFTDAGSTTHTFTSNPSLGSFSIVTVGSGAVLPASNSAAALKFRIDYRMTLPRVAVRSIWGSITQGAAGAHKLVTFQSQNYELFESMMELCSGTTGGPGCADVSLDLTTTPTNNAFYAYITAVKPYRLKVIATGYGPNSARKQLEGIIQNNFFNGLSSAAATTMIGPFTAPFRFEPGTSNGITYSGGNCGSPAGCVPSFGLTNTGSLNYVTNNPPSGNPAQMQPPPALLDPNIMPDWQQTPAALDALVTQLRQTARNSGRYFVNPTGNQANFGVGTSQNPPGTFADGRGITFCEGSCKIGADGGGILVVTGKLTNVGSFSFRGMIIVTGEEGWERNGGGTGQVIGNIIIAPYNRNTYIPQNLASAFLPPQYYITGGGGSDVIYDDVSATLNNTSSISDFMVGIAEK